MSKARADAAPDLGAEMTALGTAAHKAAAALATSDGAVRDRALHAAARALRGAAGEILAANAADRASARGLSPAMGDRLALDERRIEAMATGLEGIAALPNPLGRTLAQWDRPNGLNIARVSVPLGVIGIIYESRPNVTADAGGLCLKSGNAAILRGGSESFRSSGAILAALQAGLAEAGLPAAALQRVPTTDRAAVGHMLAMSGHIDVIIPRGGRALTERVAAESRIPVIKHLDGICHTYVHAAAAVAMARAVVVNAKMRRPGICGATETLLVDRSVAPTHLPAILDDLIAAGCAVRGDAEARALEPRTAPADADDWDREYLAPVISVRVVDGLEAAIEHVNHHGSHHTESIITADGTAAARFMAEVDAGIVMHNTSTQFADGGEFGMGAEIGISTGKLHARGPVGAEQLTSYKYLVRGAGQVRP